MTREELREMAWSLWGRDLERITLDELREGLLALQAEASPHPDDGVVVLDSAPSDYETAMREFFAETLADDSDEGFVQLWLAALELWLAIMVREERRKKDSD